MTDLERAAALVASAQHIAVLTGAGVSAESGIPTFRGPGGLWQGRDPAALATPEAFAADPKLVWELYNWRRTVVARAQPNPAHLAIAALEARVPRVSVITQNVDRLHQRAGSTGVLELHGNLWDVRCTRCSHVRDAGEEALGPLPVCEACGAPARPAVVWFGEPLPPDVWRNAESAARAADLVLVVGTSAVVYPAASLVGSRRQPGQTVIEINLEPTPLSGSIDIGLYDRAGTILPQVVPAARGV